MKIIRKVAVKQILTEASRRRTLENIRNDMRRLQKECEQLRFEWRRQQREHKYDRGRLKEKFDRELKRRHEKCNVLEYQIEQLESLPLGSEWHDGEVQALVDVEVGDDWEALHHSAIVIKDGKVHDIRYPGHEK